MDRTQKAETVDALRRQFASTSLLVVAHYSGLTVGQMTELRRRMRRAEAGLKVTKNRLARLAIKGTPYEQLDPLFKGPTAIAFSTDPVAAAKVATDYARENDKFVVLGGGLGNQLLDAKGVEALAKLPSIDELRAKILGMIVTPATRLATVLQAPGSQVARVIKAYSEKSEAA